MTRRRPRRTPNLGATTAAAITGAIGATTMATIQTMAQNPGTRFLVARSGDQVVVVKGLRKGDALDMIENRHGTVERSSARTFDTRGEAYTYAEEHLGPVTDDVGWVQNPAELRAIKRRVLR